MRPACALASLSLLCSVLVATAVQVNVADNARLLQRQAPADDILAPIPTYDKDSVDAALRAAKETIAAPSSPSFDLSGLVKKVMEGQESNKDKESLLQVDLRAAAQQKGALPPFEDLPSMAPYDGLDAQTVNPLPNPHPFKGANQELPGSGLPSAAEIMSRATLHGQTVFTPGGVLPPMVHTPGSTGLTAEAVDGEPTDVAAAFPRLLGENDQVPVFDTESAALPSIVSVLSKRNDMKDVPYVAPFTYEHYITGGDVNSLTDALPRLDAYNADVLSGAYQPRTSEYEQLEAQRSQITQSRAQYLSAMNQRKANIEKLLRYVEGGDSWVSKMEAEWDKWLEHERSKGSAAINAEKAKVEKVRQQLDALVSQQKEDAKRVNLYNTELKKAEYEFALRKRKAELASAAAKQAALQKQLDEQNKQKTQLESEIAQVDNEMRTAVGGESSTSASSDAAESSTASSSESSAEPTS